MLRTRISAAWEVCCTIGIKVRYRANRSSKAHIESTIIKVVVRVKVYPKVAIKISQSLRPNAKANIQLSRKTHCGGDSTVNAAISFARRVPRKVSNFSLNRRDMELKNTLIYTANLFKKY